VKGKGANEREEHMLFVHLENKTNGGTITKDNCYLKREITEPSFQWGTTEKGRES